MFQVIRCRLLSDSLGVSILNYIWCGIILASVAYSIINGTAQELSNSVLTSAAEAVELIIGMCGTVCLWSGMMNIADKSGASRVIAKLLSPILSKLFPELDSEGKAFNAICANITANLLGLGNAATPLGIKAMKELSLLDSKRSKTASQSMIMLVILNTSSIQLMPTMIMSILSSYGSSDPTLIIPCVWISSAFGLVVAVISVYLFGSKKIRHKGL